MINSWFGKSCENVISRCNIVTLISNPKQQKWPVCKHNVKCITIFDDEIVGMLSEILLKLS